MKKKFSLKWKSSSQIRKQRKYRTNAPLHIKSNMMKSHLSKELRKKYNLRSIRIRKGDEVKVLKGSFKRKTGKISNINIKRQRLTIEGIQRKKKDGTKLEVYFDPSNLMAISLNTDDKKRFKNKEKSKIVVKENAPKKTIDE